MTLARGYGYCLPCRQSNPISNAETLPTAAADLAVRIGDCPTCGNKIIRVLPESFAVRIPEVTAGQPEPIYGGTEYWDRKNYEYRTPRDTERTGQRWNAPVETILAMIVGSIDLQGWNGPRWENGERWADMIATKAAAGHFDSILRAIIAEGFAVPIVMWDEDATGEYLIGNGHHRFVAAMLLGLDTLPVIVSETGDYMRADDTCDDYGRPVEKAEGRAVWDVIAEHFRDANAGSARYVTDDRPCECGCQDYGQPESVPEATWQREAREASERAAAAQEEAQRAAADAVWNLRDVAMMAAADKRRRAMEMREAAARMYADADALSQEARADDDRRDAFGALYRAAREIKIADGA